MIAKQRERVDSELDRKADVEELHGWLGKGTWRKTGQKSMLDKNKEGEQGQLG